MIVANKNKNQSGGGGPVNLNAWVTANLPPLHPTRRKVLEVVNALTADGQWASSTQIRKNANLSQQLMNRHLRALGDAGLIRLERQGPGLPLMAQVAPLGSRAVGESARPETSQTLVQPEPQPSPAHSPIKAPKNAQEAVALYRALASKLKGDDLARFQKAMRPVLASLAGKKTEPAKEEAPRQELPPQSPGLTPAEAALEQRLDSSANSKYNGMIWRQRTVAFTQVFDQARKRHFGVLTTYFPASCQRWECPEWADFNYARRQADARGADYDAWIKAQMERVSPDGYGDISPQELHGEKAVQAFEGSSNGKQPTANKQGPPPYTVDSFRISNPEHTAYAEHVLDEMTELGQSIYGDPVNGAVKLLTQAISSGSFPTAALDLRPELKEKIFSTLRLGTSHHTPANNSNGRNRPAKPAVII